MGITNTRFLSLFFAVKFWKKLPLSLCFPISMLLILWQEDVKLMAEMGLESFRFSISWSRLIPSNTLFLVSLFASNDIVVSDLLNPFCLCDFPDGRGLINPKGLLFYKNLIKELISHGEVFSFTSLLKPVYSF